MTAIIVWRLDSSAAIASIAATTGAFICAAPRPMPPPPPPMSLPAGGSASLRGCDGGATFGVKPKAGVGLVIAADAALFLLLLVGKDLARRAATEKGLEPILACSSSAPPRPRVDNSPPSDGPPCCDEGRSAGTRVELSLRRRGLRVVPCPCM